MPSLVAHLLDYIYFFRSQLFHYILLLIKELLNILYEFWILIIYTFGYSRKQLLQFQSVKYYKCPIETILIHRLQFLPRKIFVLDLDETLIHSRTNASFYKARTSLTCPPDFIIHIEIDRNPVRFFVYKRPHLDYFLEIISQWYELVVFTAAIQSYGKAITDKLDNHRNLISRRYFREHCTFQRKSYSKNLSIVHKDLSQIFILDNSPSSYRFCQYNAIGIKSWFNDPKDTCLLSLIPFLDALRFCRDVRSVLAMNLHSSYSVQKQL